MEEFVSYMKKYDIETILEIGALNDADVMYFRSQFPEARIITVEGLPDNYNKYLKGSKEFEAYNIILNSYDGKVEFIQKELNGIHSIYDRGDHEKTVQVLELPCMRADTFCKKNNIDKIDALKIDVEGAAYDVLLGFSKELLHTVKIIHIETEDYEFFKGQHLRGDVHQILIDNGFKKILEKSWNTAHKQYDELWVRAEE